MKIWVAAFVCLTGCMGNMGLSSLADSEVNIYNLARISKGMSQRDVYAIMHMPYDYDTIYIGADIYDVWFYTTTPTVLGQSRMVPQNLTPLTFKNGMFIGRGYPIYDSVLKLKEGKVKPPAPPEHREDKAIEKTLQAMNKRSTPPPAPMTRTLDEEVPPDEDNPADKPAPKKKAKPEERKAFDKEGERMNEDASEQDFDYW